MTKSEYKHEWYLQNIERILAQRAVLRASEGYSDYQHKVWLRRKADPIRLASKYEGNKRRGEAFKQKIFEALGSICCKCGFSDKRALQIDHVKGGGHEHRIRVGFGNVSYYKSIAEDPELNTKFQILCANCNWIKRFENKEN